MKKLKAVLIGAGGRGADTYANYLLNNPDEMEVIAVCEANQTRREKVRKLHNIKSEYCFATWEDLLDKPVIAELAMICTQDDLHYQPAVMLMKKGYDLLLEKPMSNQVKECIAIEEAARKYDRKVIVCHVLRYTPFFTLIKSLVTKEVLGKMIAINLSENVAYWHYAMSYVRGAWSKEENSSPMILAKSCHDLDILNWLIEDECEKIASFGQLNYFKRENAPLDAPLHCQDGCRHSNECPWEATKFFMENPKFLHQYTNTNEETPLEEKLMKLHQSDYGRCVFHCDNNVVDHQSTILKYKNGVSVNFTMSAFTNECGRTIQIMGTKGELIGNMVTNSVEVRDFLTGRIENYSLEKEDFDTHFGGDSRLMEDVIACLREDKKVINSSATVSLMSHIMAFAAEKARLESRVIDIKEYYHMYACKNRQIGANYEV